MWCFNIQQWITYVESAQDIISIPWNTMQIFFYKKGQLYMW
jgi:hypothetical protein